MSDNTTPVFVIDPAPVPWPVDVRVPAAGGAFETRRFAASINVLAEAEHEALLASADPKAGEPPKTEKDHLDDNARIFPRYIAGWEGVNRADGTPVPFNEQALADLVRGPLGKAVSAGFWKAIAEVRHGVRLGNFEAPPVTG